MFSDFKTVFPLVSYKNLIVSKSLILTKYSLKNSFKTSQINLNNFSQFSLLSKNKLSFLNSASISIYKGL